MLLKRVIPSLLYSGNGLYKTIKFAKKKYIGDVINAVRLFNDLGADELIVLDIDASKNNRGPNFDLLENLVSECFMPLTYGGGIRSLGDAATLLRLGIEKICINDAVMQRLDLVDELVAQFGSSSIVVSVDFKKNLFGKRQLYSHKLNKAVDLDLVDYAKNLAQRGAGEIFLTSVDREGTQTGFDLDFISKVAHSVDVPVIAHGGCGDFYDVISALDAGASAVSCGSKFVYNGRHNAVLISYLTKDEYKKLNPEIG